VKKANIGAEVLRVDVAILSRKPKSRRRSGALANWCSNTSMASVVRHVSAAGCNVSDDADSPLWYWCEVADWLYENNMITIAALRDAQALFVD